MSIPRIFLASELTCGEKIFLDDRSAKHVLQVLRLSVGSKLVIFNGQSGGEFCATITKVAHKTAEVILDRFVAKDVESSAIIHLGQGIAKGEKMDFTIQKAVELGVSSITPIFTQYCNVKLDPERSRKRLQHWQNIAISAAEQSGRCLVPKILSPKFLAEWLTENRYPLSLILHPEAKTKFSELTKSYSEITLLIGPEGGFSDDEIKLAKKSNFIAVNLGQRILRTETAALAAISAIQARWGDF